MGLGATAAEVVASTEAIEAEAVASSEALLGNEGGGGESHSSRDGESRVAVVLATAKDLRQQRRCYWKLRQPTWWRLAVAVLVEAALVLVAQKVAKLIAA